MALGIQGAMNILATTINATWPQTHRASARLSGIQDGTIYTGESDFASSAATATPSRQVSNASGEFFIWGVSEFDDGSILAE